MKVGRTSTQVREVAAPRRTRADRVPKGKRGAWTQRIMKDAFKAVVTNTINFNAAVPAFKVPRATLKRYID